MPHLNDKKIAVIILNYNNAEDTIACVQSVRRWERDTCEVIIVDNCSTDDSVAVIRKTLTQDDYHLIISSTNQGYAAGNNLGIAYAASQGYSFLCILNNDTVLTSNSLSLLTQFLERNKNCSIVGPAICEYYNPSIVQSAGASINLLKGSVSSLFEGIYFEDLPKTPYACDYIGGACMMFRTKDLTKLNYLPENYFLFFEETEWCYQASKRVGCIMCDPSVAILHKGSASIDKNNINKSDLLIKNSVVFEYRNANIGQFVLFSLRFFLVSIGSVILHGKTSAKRFKLFADALQETSKRN